MTSLALSPALPSFTEDPLIIEAFTQGDCWLLALALHERLGLPVALVAYSQDPEGTWAHAGNLLPGGAFVDITGVMDPQEALEVWGDFLEEEDDPEGLDYAALVEIAPAAFPQAFIHQEAQYADVAQAGEWALVVEAGLRVSGLL